MTVLGLNCTDRNYHEINIHKYEQTNNVFLKLNIYIYITRIN